MKQNKLFAIALLFLCVIAVSACTRNAQLTGGSNWPGLTSEDDIVYSANGSFVEAVRDGKKLWSYPAEANRNLSFYAVPAVDDKYVYVGTYSNQLHILNKADGTLAASVEIGNNKNKIIASPLVAEGKVYAVSSGGMVSSYNVNVSGETMTPNWQSTLTSEAWVKPVLYNGTLYVASMEKKLHLLDDATGQAKDSLAIGAVMSDIVLKDGKLYFTTLSKEVNEMDLATNEIRTLLTTEGEIWASPLLMGDKLIAADMKGYVYCIDIASGSTVWKTEKLTPEKSGFIASPIALDEETILLLDESGYIMTYDMDGKSIGQRALGQSSATTPVVLSNGSFAVTPITAEDGLINAYTPELKEDWIFTRSAASAADAAAEPTVEATVDTAAEPTAEPTAAEAK